MSPDLRIHVLTPRLLPFMVDAESRHGHVMYIVFGNGICFHSQSALCDLMPTIPALFHHDRSADCALCNENTWC